MKDIIERMKHPHFLAELNKNNEVAGYQSPTSGRITYNKVVSKRSFAVFTDIIESIVPVDIVLDHDNNHVIPSIARVLNESYGHVYQRYMYVNVTMDEYMDYDNEEDQENMDAVLEVLDELPLKTPLVGVTVQKSEAMQSAHASAFIAWQHSSRKYKFAYYDPLAFKRGRSTYDYAERAFVSDRFEQDIEFINLSAYCFQKGGEEFHCSQYIMNAEYCYVYSIYFLHKWIEFGAKLHRNSLKKAIKATYIVEPEKLTRSDNRESMIYRVVMMAFVCSSLSKYLASLTKKERKYIPDVAKNIQRIEEYRKGFRQLYGFDLV
jgi:hypothetical protein